MTPLGPPDAVTAGAWRTVAVVVPEADVDLASGLLWSGGAAGVEERPAAGEGQIELRAGVTVERLASVVGEVERRWTTRVEVVDDDGCLDEWRAWARPWRAGNRIVVVPMWQPRPDWIGPDDVALGIDPGRAFGSGSHPTTRMCLAELERLVEPGSTVADVGCGSGVLAIAAARLGAAAVAAVDVDGDAVRATTANVEANGVAGVVTATTTPAAELVSGGYDVVVANIGAGVLVVLASAVAAAVAPEGSVVLSGLLEGQVLDVLAAFAAVGFALVATSAEGEWRAVVLRREDRASS